MAAGDCEVAKPGEDLQLPRGAARVKMRTLPRWSAHRSPPPPAPGFSVLQSKLALPQGTPVLPPTTHPCPVGVWALAFAPVLQPGWPLRTLCWVEQPGRHRMHPVGVCSQQGPGGVRPTETEKRGGRGCGSGWELVFDGDRVSTWEGERMLETQQCTQCHGQCLKR